MNAALREVERLVAGFAWVEIARAISLEATYQTQGGTLGRREWYQGHLVGWTPIPRPCLYCGETRYWGIPHLCPTAYLLATRRLG